MAARAISDLKNALIKVYKVKSGTTTVIGKRVKFDAADDAIDNAGAADDGAFGTAIEAKTGNAAGSVTCEVILDFFAVVPMLVGTGGASRGAKQVAVSDGVTDAAAVGTAAGKPLVGVALQTGVLGDVIGVGLLNGRITTV